MKRNHKRFLALCLSASMLVSPLSYTKAYASSDEAGVTENSSQNETVAESENKSESQSPAAEEAGNASSQEKENASNNNSNTANAEKSDSVAEQQESQQTAETGQVQSEASDGENAIVQTANAPTVTGNTVQVVQENGNVFAMFKITTSTVKKNGELYDVSFTTSSNYDKIYLGSKNDEVKEPVVKRSTDGTNTFTFKVDASKVGKVQSVVLGKQDGSWYTQADLWIYIPEETVTEPGTNTTPEPELTPRPEPTPTTPEDGSYNNIGVTSSASMFKVVDCKLVVKDGKLTAVLTLSGTGYGYLYKGTKEEAAAADKSTWIPFVEDVNGKYTYSLPLNSLAENKVKLAAYSTKYAKWYDRELTFDFSNMNRIYPTAADGTYSIEVETGAAMFKVVDCKLTVKNGLMSAVITLSGTGYDYLYMGTGADAEKADRKSWVPYVVDANGKYTYTIPVEALDKEIAVASHSIKKNQWYARTLTFKYDTLQKISDDSNTNPSNPSTPSKPSDNNGNGNSGASNPNDGKADNESKWEADTSGSTSAVNSSTTLADGVYTPDRFSWSGGTGKVKITCNKVTIQNGQAYATLVFDSDHYQYVKADGKTYYTTKGGGMATVVIPIALNQNNTILGMTDKMSVAHEIAYTIFVYLAAAGNGKGAGTVQNKTLDDKAPEIMGLNYESETRLEHAEYFKIYHYDKGITLLEVDVTKDTIRDPKKKDSDNKDTDTNKATDTNEDSNKSEETSKDQTSEAADSAEGGEAVVGEAEQAAELYKGNVIKYLLVPENTVIPVGLSEDMIVVQMPTDQAYVSDNEILKQMEEMDLLDQVAAVGMKKKNCEVSDIADKMSKKKDEKQAEVIYGGKERDPKYRDLVKQEVNLALVSSDLLPAEDKTTKKGKTITEEDQIEQWEKITEKYALLGIPMIVDRSEDEKDDLAKAEWIKVYGVIFGCEDQANALYNKVVQQAGEK